MSKTNMEGKRKNYFERFKEKWGVKSNFQLVIIFVVFAINGSISVKISDPVMEFFSLNKEHVSGWIYYPVRILLIFPIYQVLLLVVGSIFGQFRFFWEFEKKTIGRMFPKRKSK